MKKMSQIAAIFMLGAITSFAMNVAAEAVISSGSVSYGNTTVNTALDELFSAVDINEKIGTSDITGIGNGTITGSISEINNNTSITIETLKENVTLIRQGKRRLLKCKGALTDYVGTLLQLDTKDWPFEYVYNNLLMVTSDTFYSGFFRLTSDGKVNVYWYVPGGKEAVIGNEQMVFGQIEWYVP